MEDKSQGKPKAKGVKMEQEGSKQKNNAGKKAPEQKKPDAVKGNGDATEQNTSNNEQARSSRRGQNTSANVKSPVRQKRKIVPSKTDKTLEEQPKKRVKQLAQSKKKPKINVQTLAAKPADVTENQEEKEHHETKEEQMDWIEWTVVDESKCENESEEKVEEANRATVSRDNPPPKFDNMNILKSPLIQAKIAAEDEIRKIMGLDESKPVIFSAESLQTVKLDGSECDYKPNVFTVDWKDIEVQLSAPPLSQRCQPSTAMTGPPETYVASSSEPESRSTVDQNVVHVSTRELKDCKLCDVTFKDEDAAFSHFNINMTNELCAERKTHVERFLYGQMMLGFQEFAHRYPLAECPLYLYWEGYGDLPDYKTSLISEAHALFIYRCGMYLKNLCQPCQSQSFMTSENEEIPMTPAERWLEHCLSTEHQQMFIEKSATMDNQNVISSMRISCFPPLEWISKRPKAIYEVLGKLAIKDSSEKDTSVDKEEKNEGSKNQLVQGQEDHLLKEGERTNKTTRIEQEMNDEEMPPMIQQEKNDEEKEPTRIEQEKNDEVKEPTRIEQYMIDEEMPPRIQQEKNDEEKEPTRIKQEKNDQEKESTSIKQEKKDAPTSTQKKNDDTSTSVTQKKKDDASTSITQKKKDDTSTSITQKKKDDTPTSTQKKKDDTSTSITQKKKDDTSTSITQKKKGNAPTSTQKKKDNTPTGITQKKNDQEKKTTKVKGEVPVLPSGVELPHDTWTGEQEQLIMAVHSNSVKDTGECVFENCHYKGDELKNPVMFKDHWRYRHMTNETRVRHCCKCSKKIKFFPKAPQYVAHLMKDCKNGLLNHTDAVEKVNANILEWAKPPLRVLVGGDTDDELYTFCATVSKDQFVVSQDAPEKPSVQEDESGVKEDSEEVLLPYDTWTLAQEKRIMDVHSRYVKDTGMCFHRECEFHQVFKPYLMNPVLYKEHWRCKHMVEAARMTPTCPNCGKTETISFLFIKHLSVQCKKRKYTQSDATILFNNMLREWAQPPSRLIIGGETYSDLYPCCLTITEASACVPEPRVIKDDDMAFFIREAKGHDSMLPYDTWTRAQEKLIMEVFEKKVNVMWGGRCVHPNCANKSPSYHCNSIMFKEHWRTEHMAADVRLKLVCPSCKNIFTKSPSLVPHLTQRCPKKLYSYLEAVNIVNSIICEWAQPPNRIIIGGRITNALYPLYPTVDGQRTPTGPVTLRSTKIDDKLEKGIKIDKSKDATTSLKNDDKLEKSRKQEKSKYATSLKIEDKLEKSSKKEKSKDATTSLKNDVKLEKSRKKDKSNDATCTSLKNDDKLEKSSKEEKSKDATSLKIGDKLEKSSKKEKSKDATTSLKNDVKVEKSSKNEKKMKNVNDGNKVPLPYDTWTRAQEQEVMDIHYSKIKDSGCCVKCNYKGSDIKNPVMFKEHWRAAHMAKDIGLHYICPGCKAITQRSVSFVQHLTQRCLKKTHARLEAINMVNNMIREWAQPPNRIVIGGETEHAIFPLFPTIDDNTTLGKQNSDKEDKAIPCVVKGNTSSVPVPVSVPVSVPASGLKKNSSFVLDEKQMPFRSWTLAQEKYIMDVHSRTVMQTGKCIHPDCKFSSRELKVPVFFKDHWRVHHMILRNRITYFCYACKTTLDRADLYVRHLAVKCFGQTEPVKIVNSVIKSWAKPPERIFIGGQTWKAVYPLYPTISEPSPTAEVEEIDGRRIPYETWTIAEERNLTYLHDKSVKESRCCIHPKCDYVSEELKNPVMFKDHWRIHHMADNVKIKLSCTHCPFIANRAFLYIIHLNDCCPSNQLLSKSEAGQLYDDILSKWASPPERIVIGGATGDRMYGYCPTIDEQKESATVKGTTDIISSRRVGNISQTSKKHEPPFSRGTLMPNIQGHNIFTQQAVHDPLMQGQQMSGQPMQSQPMQSSELLDPGLKETLLLLNVSQQMIGQSIQETCIPGQPMPDQFMPGSQMPGQQMQGQQMQGQQMLGQFMPGQQMQIQQMQGQQVQGQHMQRQQMQGQQIPEQQMPGQSDWQRTSSQSVAGPTCQSAQNTEPTSHAPADERRDDRMISRQQREVPSSSSRNVYDETARYGKRALHSTEPEIAQYPQQKKSRFSEPSRDDRAAPGERAVQMNEPPTQRTVAPLTQETRQLLRLISIKVLSVLSGHESYDEEILNRLNGEQFHLVLKIKEHANQPSATCLHIIKILLEYSDEQLDSLSSLDLDIMRRKLEWIASSGGILQVIPMLQLLPQIRPAFRNFF